jgi:natural product precursor
MKKKILKKKLLKKLTLSKETLRNLESSDLRDAVGGVTFFPCSTNCTYYYQCYSDYC